MRWKRQSFLERDVTNQWHILQPKYPVAIGQRGGRRELRCVHVNCVPSTPPSRKGEVRAPVVPIEQARSLRLKEVELLKEAVTGQAGL